MSKLRGKEPLLLLRCGIIYFVGKGLEKEESIRLKVKHIMGSSDGCLYDNLLSQPIVLQSMIKQTGLTEHFSSHGNKKYMYKQRI